MDRAASEWSGVMRMVAEAALCAPLVLSLVGCGEEEPPPPPPPPVKRDETPPPPPPPEQVEISSIMRALGADARVAFPQANAPYDRSLAEAVIGFAGALLDPDDPTAFGSYLDDSGKTQLDEIDLSVGWFETVEPIEGVRVVGLEQDPPRSEEADSATVLLAVQEADGAYLVGWTVAKAGGWVFSGLDVGLQERDRASEFDGEGVSAMAAGGDDSGPAFDIVGYLNRSMSTPLNAAFSTRAVEFITGMDPLENAEEMGSFSRNNYVESQYGSIDGYIDAVNEGLDLLDDGERPDPSDVVPAVQINVATARHMKSAFDASESEMAQDMFADEIPTVVETVAEVLGITDEDAEAFVNEGRIDDLPSDAELTAILGESIDWGAVEEALGQ